MKKSLLILAATALFFSSCKKETTTEEFSQTDVTGTTVVKGSVSKNVITPNGAGGWVNTTRVPVSGVNVTVKINKSALYPGSQAVGADIYSGTTDAQGNYAISVKTNATGAAALITIDGFSGTQDTLINGVTKAGYYATYAGTSQNVTLFMGSNYVMNHQFNATNLSTNPNNITVGSAIITGSISQNINRSVTTGTNVAFSTTNIAVPAGVVVYMSFANDPTLLTAKQYTTTTDAQGYYTFNLATVAPGTTGFPQNATIWINDRAATRDTLKIVNTTITGTVTGVQGVFNGGNTNQNGVFNGEIRNATHFSYSGFTPN
ncbi:MAG: hypothetical protein K0S32_2618 [Bacteroidetes bacterium]|jgi:hypothetical protein|nr:hypothetical protein [Bacteroidota bacterium]